MECDSNEGQCTHDAMRIWRMLLSSRKNLSCLCQEEKAGMRGCSMHKDRGPGHGHSRTVNREILLVWKM